LIIGFNGRQHLGRNVQIFHKGQVAVALRAQLHDLLGRAGGAFAQPVHDVPIGLGDVDRRMTVIAAANGLLERYTFFVDARVDGVQMAIFAIGF